MRDRYVHGHSAAVLRSHGWRTAANSAGHLLPHLAPGMDLLDLGSGGGTITADLADVVAPGRVVATEIDDAALAVTAAAVGDRATVELRVADAHALPFADDTFDVSHAHQVLQHLADPVQALRELARVTRPGGLVAVRDADYAAMAWYPGSPGLEHWQETYQRVARDSGGEPDAGRRLLAWAHAAGLADISVGASAWCFAEPADRQWWGGTWAERVERSTFADKARALGVTAGHLARQAAAWQRWADEPDGWFLVPHGWLVIRVP